jgi:hypothetical protein
LTFTNSKKILKSWLKEKYKKQLSLAQNLFFVVSTGSLLTKWLRRKRLQRKPQRKRAAARRRSDKLPFL